MRRERTHVTRWYSALSEAKLATQTTELGKDYWTAQGEQRTSEEIEALRVRAGYQPAPPPAYRPIVQTPLHIVPDREPRQDAEVSTTPAHEQRAEPRQDAEVSAEGETPRHMVPDREPRQDADIYITNTSRQDAEVSAARATPTGCPDCGQPIAIGGYCLAHFTRHRDTNQRRAEGLGYAYAAVGAD